MPEVAFCRTLKPGMSGNDVEAHKRAISRAMPNVYQWDTFTDYFGPNFVTAVKAYQKSHAIPQTGVIGTTTHNSLEKAHRKGHPTEPAFDDYAAKLAHDFCVEFTKTPEQRVREAIVSYALYAYSHRLGTYYSQARPMLLAKFPDVPVRMDCSGFATECHYAANALDPNGRGYDHEGYTGTLIDHGVKVSDVYQLELGSLIFYGYSNGTTPGFKLGDPTHVAVYVGIIQGKPSVVSDGHYPMGLYPWNYRTPNQMRNYKVV